MTHERRDVAQTTSGSLFRLQAVAAFGFVVLIWAIEIFDRLTPWWTLDAFGIVPRTLIGLRGVLFAPFLHGNFAHVTANTIPFLVLGWFIILRGRNDIFSISTIVMLIGGLGTWLFGAANSIHIGASGLIFGYLGFLMLIGFFERRLVSILMSVLVIFIYGGLLWGVLPLQVGVSWQSHLFGFVGGIMAAYLLAERETVLDHIRLLEHEEA